MKLRYAGFLGFLGMSCVSPQEPNPPIVGKPDRAKKPSPCPPCDSLNPRYTPFQENFYKDSKGEVYELKQEYNPSDSCCPLHRIFDERFGISTDRVRKPLKEVLDFPTYVALKPSIYSKDKNRVYVFRDNSNGGFRYIVEGANPKTFLNLDSTFFWGMDHQHVFYQGELIEGFSPKNLKALPMVLSNPESSDQLRIVRGKPFYVKNEKQVFYETREVVEADAPSFRVVDSPSFDAIDKYRRYQSGRAKN